MRLSLKYIPDIFYEIIEEQKIECDDGTAFTVPKRIKMTESFIKELSKEHKVYAAKFNGSLEIWIEIDS